MFRMAHVFLALGQIDQAHHVAVSTANALEPKITTKAEPEVLSLCGALHLVLAVAASRDNRRSQAREHLEIARTIADQLGQAHAMRGQIGEALHALQEAERIAPEETRVHYVGRAAPRELLQLSRLRPRPELRDLAERFGVLP